MMACGEIKEFFPICTCPPFGNNLLDDSISLKMETQPCMEQQYLCHAQEGIWVALVYCSVGGGRGGVKIKSIIWWIPSTVSVSCF